MLMNIFLSYWAVEEYLNNIYFQAYVNDLIQANGSLIAILVIVCGVGIGLGLHKRLKSKHLEIGALVNEPQMPQVPSSGPVGSSSKPEVDLHPMVAALKAEMAHHASMEPLPPVEVKEAPSTPVQAPLGPPPARTLAVVPTTIITGTMPVLKKANPEQDKNQNSNR
jgi:hypothetical protein